MLFGNVPRVVAYLRDELQLADSDRPSRFYLPALVISEEWTRGNPNYRATLLVCHDRTGASCVRAAYGWKAGQFLEQMDLFYPVEIDGLSYGWHYFNGGILHATYSETPGRSKGLVET